MPQWYLGDRLPVTVAGAAAVSNRVPLNPLREPRAFSNANGRAGCRQFGGAGAEFQEYFVLSQVFESRRRVYAGIIAEGLITGTICRISKFGQIGRQNRRRSFRTRKCEAWTFRYTQTGV